MILLVAFVFVLLVIGVVVVIRSGWREIVMDEKDQELADVVPPEQFQMLPRFTTKPEKEQESWTLESAEDTDNQNENL